MRIIDADAWIEKLSNSFVSPNYHPDLGDAFQCMEDERHNEDIYDLIMQINEQPTIEIDKWIPIIEKLPEKSDSYRVTKMCHDEDKIIYETCNEIFWTRDNKWDCERDDLCEWKVIAWKHKEEPYKI